MKKTGELPAAFQSFRSDPRVMVRRAGEPVKNGRCIVYWMQRAQRGLDNPALDLGIRVGNEVGLPVVVFVSIISKYPNANLRHYAFLEQGLPDIGEDLASRNVALVVRRPPENRLEEFLEEVGAALLIGDENHCREPERWRRVLARRLRLPFLTVDADVVVPSRLFQKHYYALHHFKPHLQRELPNFLVSHAAIKAEREWKRPANLSAFHTGASITEGWNDLDRSVAPVEAFTGGTKAALRRLNDFVADRLKDYGEKRNHPELDGTSQLSPYLHFGHLGPLTIALAARSAVRSGRAKQASLDAFLNELIGWRELSINFVKHVPDYDSFACALDWAKKTLREHARDRRPYNYDLGTMERAETHDDLWTPRSCRW